MTRIVTPHAVGQMMMSCSISSDVALPRLDDQLPSPLRIADAPLLQHREDRIIRVGGPERVGEFLREAAGCLQPLRAASLGELAGRAPEAARPRGTS